MKFVLIAFVMMGVMIATVIAQPRVRAPEFDGASGWLNTDRPLTLAALRGKVVLLDFWTYGCINCIHIIPDLKKLEAKYGDSLVVIGVHSAKFTNEGETENIRRIVLRYGVEHAIVNDAKFRIWNNYAVRAWPTQVVIDPAGYVIGYVAGEGHYDDLDALIGETIDTFRKKGQLDEKPVKLALERAKAAPMPLSFPGKILADERGNRLFISDSNHHRIVVTDLAGKLLTVIGNGTVGRNDGNFTEASFYRPQGIALDGETLYVADTDNQLIRAVDLKTKRVTTIAGTGSLRDFDGEAGPALTTSLRSPWDLAVNGRDLFIAMAGSHQIWRLRLDTRVIEPYAGSRVEARLDGPLAVAGFAQPSGLATDGKSLFVADSESNIIREINYAKKRVTTLAGGDLFEFGDEDGFGDDVRFQHPLGIIMHDGKLLIADTYNHKIRTLDPRSGEAGTLVGIGKPGQSDGRLASFYEPGGLSAAAGKLFVADTNNHAVRVVDLKTKTVSTLRISGLKPPVTALAETLSEGPNAATVAIPTVALGANQSGTLNVALQMPAGFHLNANAPNRFEVKTSGTMLMTSNASTKFDSLPLRIPVRTGAPGASDVELKLTVYYCREDDTGVCLIKTLNLKIPFEIGEKGPAEATIDAVVEAPNSR